MSPNGWIWNCEADNHTTSHRYLFADHGPIECNNVAGMGANCRPVGEGIVLLNRLVNSNVYAAVRRQ